MLIRYLEYSLINIQLNKVSCQIKNILCKNILNIIIVMSILFTFDPTAVEKV